MDKKSKVVNFRSSIEGCLENREAEKLSLFICSPGNVALQVVPVVLVGLID